MTPLNTIIEEEKEAFDAFLDQYTGKHEKDNWLKNTYYADTVQVRKDLIVKQFCKVLTAAMQRAYEAGRADWLRSEIEKLEGMWRAYLIPKEGRHDYDNGYNQALTSIITRYKEELKVLEQ